MNGAAASSYMLTAVYRPAMGVIDLTPDDGIVAGFDVLSNYVDLTATVSIGAVYTQAYGSTGGMASASYNGFNAGAYDRSKALRGSASAGQPLQGADKVSFSTARGVSEIAP